GDNRGVQVKALAFADRAPVVLSVVEGSSSPFFKEVGPGRRSSLDSSASTARDSLTSSPACSSTASVAGGGEGDLRVCDAVRVSSPVAAVSPLGSAGTAMASDGGGGRD
ncbi:unnamed protein product, partial [Laminaria digitata]